MNQSFPNKVYKQAVIFVYDEGGVILRDKKGFVTSLFATFEQSTYCCFTVVLLASSGCDVTKINVDEFIDGWWLNLFTKYFMK